MRGRHNKPTNLRAIEGNGGKRSLETYEPEPRAADEEPPEYFDHYAREMWKRLFAELRRAVGITVLDTPRLAFFCESYSRYRRAEKSMIELVFEEGSTTAKPVLKTTYVAHGRNGKQIKTRPEYHMMHEEVRLMNSIGAEFGLSPAARVRLRGLGQLGLFDDPLDQLNEQFGGGRQGQGA